jgi:hypothetical protein
MTGGAAVALQSSTLGLPGTIDVCNLIQVRKEISIGLFNFSVFRKAPALGRTVGAFEATFIAGASASISFALPVGAQSAAAV